MAFNCSEPFQAQPARISINDLFVLYNLDIARVKNVMASNGFKLSYNGEKFGNVHFYQWYHGRTSHNADAFMQRYIPDNTEKNKWNNDCLEYIVYNEDQFKKMKRYCELIKMKLKSSGLKDFTYDDSYIRDPGSFYIYQNDKYWVHFNIVQEDDKIAYKVLVRKNPE